MTLNKILKICFLLMFTIGAKFTAYTQHSYKIMGTVLNQDESLLVQGNVLIYTVSDSSFITGAFIREGQFELPLITLPQVIIKITSLENSDRFINIDNHLNQDSILLGDIILSSNTVLNEVVVTDYVPLFEYEGTTTVVNVEKTILSASASPLEI